MNGSVTLNAIENNAPPCDRPILVGSCPSSGSTLLSVMLDAHPDVASGPELSLFAHPFFLSADGPSWKLRIRRYLELAQAAGKLPEWRLGKGVCPYGELVYDNTLPWYDVDRARLLEWVDEVDSGAALVERIMTPVLAREGKRIWAEKSPNNIYGFGSFLERYPRGSIVYLVRDGRDVVCSLLRRGFGFKRAMSIWLVETLIADSYREHPRVFPVRYEDLVADPQGVLGELCRALEIAKSAEQMANYQQNSRRVREQSALLENSSWLATPREGVLSRSVGRWREELRPEHLTALNATAVVEPVETFEAEGGFVGRTFPGLLAELGYEALEPRPADSADLAELLLSEALFLRGEDYDVVNRRIFQERFVACQADALAGCDLDWSNLCQASRAILVPLLGRRNRDADEVGRLSNDRARLYNELDNTRGVVAGLSEAGRGLVRYCRRQTSRLLGRKSPLE